MGFVRRLQRHQSKQQEVAEENTEEVVPENHLQLPVGNVLSDPVRGEHLAFPIFGWVCRRVKVNTPLVMITYILLESIENTTPCGIFQLELPIFPKTELPTLGLLESLGWDGRIWPEDKGWPDGSSDDEITLKSLMDKANLKASLTFPPNRSGAKVQSIHISRAKGAFLMPPLDAYEGDPDPEKLAKLRTLCENSSNFFMKSPK